MKKEIRKKILEKTFETLATPVDIVLFTLLTIFEIGLAKKRQCYTYKDRHRSCF